MLNVCVYVDVKNLEYIFGVEGQKMMNISHFLSTALAVQEWNFDPFLLIFCATFKAFMYMCRLWISPDHHSM